MSGLGGLRVLVAGAGAVGSTIAWRLQRSGARVVLADPAGPGDNASGIAAGMLAPAFEAALDPASAEHFSLLTAARERWPALAAELEADGAAVDRCGALWVGDAASLERMQHRLRGLGAAPERLTAQAAAALSPGLRAPAGAILVREDWRLDPGAMLAALHEAFRAAGGERLSAAVTAVDQQTVRLRGGQAVAVDHAVVATGMPPQDLIDPPDELAVLRPIKGQIARILGAGPAAGPALRCEGAYVVPARGGAIVGATMEPGRADRRVEPAVLERLRALASPLFPELADAPLSGAAGVRASTPDALPMAGPSSRPGVTLALGARRNGWLLAPLIAEIVCAQLAGDHPGEWAAAFDPLRAFSPPG